MIRGRARGIRKRFRGEKKKRYRDKRRRGRKWNGKRGIRRGRRKKK